MRAKHIPGPWVARKYIESGEFHVMTEIGVFVADCSGASIDNASMYEANARLIAAAPDLLADLKYAVHLLAQDDHPTVQIQVVRMLKTIARAEMPDSEGSNEASPFATGAQMLAEREPKT